MALWLAGDPRADALLERNALALLIGMVLDQQVPFERAFAAPLELQARLGVPLSARSIATIDPATLTEAFTRTKALHRFPGAMAARVLKLSQIAVDEWGGTPEAIWTTAPSGAELVARLRGLPGFGEQKARIFAALLGKQLGCRPKGWREATSPYGNAGTYVSVADINDERSKDKVRAHKQQMKAAHRAAST